MGKSVVSAILLTVVFVVHSIITNLKVIVAVLEPSSVATAMAPVAAPVPAIDVNLNYIEAFEKQEASSPATRIGAALLAKTTLRA